VSAPQISIPQSAPAAPAPPALVIAPSASPVPEQVAPEQSASEQSGAPPVVAQARPSRAARTTPQRPQAIVPRNRDQADASAIAANGPSVAPSTATNVAVPTITPADLPSEAVESAPVVIAEQEGVPYELIILGGGALIAAGFGAVYVGSRRRRLSNDVPDNAEQVTLPVAPTASPVIRPATTALPSRPVTAPMPGSVATLTRPPTGGRRPVGYHEMLAERGPSADNPFLTRKNRLRRARFYDRQQGDFAVPPRIGAAGR
jgi:resuscitation-promoting factor RpfA